VCPKAEGLPQTRATSRNIASEKNFGNRVQRRAGSEKRLREEVASWLREGTGLGEEEAH